MSLNEILLLLVTIVLSIVVRLVFSLQSETDDWYTRWRIVFQRGQPYNYRTPLSIQKGFSGSPKFYYYLLSFCSPRRLKLTALSLNILFDLLVVGILYFMILRDRLSSEEAVLACLIYSTSPILVPLTARFKGIKARTFGLLLTTLDIVFYHHIFNLNTLSIYWIILASILVVLTLTSSAFGMQVMFFVFIGYSIAYQSIVPLLYVFIPLFISWFIPFTGVKFVLKHKLNHYLWYYKNQKGTTTEGRNNWLDLLLLPMRFFKMRYKAYETIFKKNSFVIILYSCPVLLIIIFQFDQITFYEIKRDENLYWLFITSTILLICFFLTSLKPFLFLGEAERYVEFGYIYIVAFYFMNPRLDSLFSTQAPILLCFHFVIILFLLLYDNRVYFSSVSKESVPGLELCKFLRNDSIDRRILTMPLKLSFYISNNLSDKFEFKYYYLFVTEEINGFKKMQEDSMFYDNPISDLRHFQSRYGINTIVCRNVLTGRYKDLAEWELIFSNSEYSVYERFTI